MEARRLKLLVWNILQGGGRRRKRIATAILEHNPDVIALVEYVPSTAAPMLRVLREAGFRYEVCTERSGFSYALCVLSRVPVTARRSGIPLLDDSGLWLEVTVAEYGFGAGIVHAPTTPRRRMREFLDALIEVASQRVSEPFVFTGDFNTGIGPADGPLRNFGDVDRFQALLDLGFRDAWRHMRGDCIEHTWRRGEKRYRIDHALISPALLGRIRDCRYSHAEREEGASDHSVLLVEFAGD